MKSTPDLVSRFEGCLLGLAVGDALGAFFEGQPAEYIVARYATPAELVASPPRDEMYYTDDTQMAIGVAETLLAAGEIDQETLCAQFVANYVPARGYGLGARRVLDAMTDGLDHRAVAERVFPGGSFGNGAAMRVAPVGLYFHRDLDRVRHQARESALPTHVHPLGIEGAQLVALAVALACRDEVAPGDFAAALHATCTTDEFASRLRLLETMHAAEALPLLGNGIAALDSAVTAIGCFVANAESYSDTIGTAILLGGDTDTIAAMAGAITGAYLGIDAIPPRLLASLEDTPKGRTYIKGLGTQLAAHYAR